VYEPEAFISYCKEHDILSFSIPADRFLEELADSDLISYVFTTNDEAEAQRLFDLGADVVGTDFLR
jgi:glycerophosphoryl diester phosphodiesterase